MTIAARLTDYLDRLGIHYDPVGHPRTATSMGSARAAYIPAERLAKAVLIHHELGYLLAVVPGTHRVELGTLQDILGKRLGLASEEEVQRAFPDCAPGALPPVGAAYDLPVLVDEALDDAPELFFEGGDHTTLVHVGQAAFRALTKEARRARFSHAAAGAH